ncbi:unnamed protein product [Boreogadus saida]
MGLPNNPLEHTRPETIATLESVDSAPVLNKNRFSIPIPNEKNNFIVLIFLEKAASNSKYLRLRKRLYRRSVLEWPTNPQAQPYFWFGLRSVLATESNKQYSDMFRETL